MRPFSAGCLLAGRERNGPRRRPKVPDGEVFWALLAYTTFEAGALPSLLRLRRPAAKEQPAAQSVSPRLRGNLGEYHCLPVATLSGLCFLLFNPSRITQIS